MELRVKRLMGWRGTFIVLIYLYRSLTRSRLHVLYPFANQRQSETLCIIHWLRLGCVVLVWNGEWAPATRRCVCVWCFVYEMYGVCNLRLAVLRAGCC